MPIDTERSYIVFCLFSNELLDSATTLLVHFYKVIVSCLVVAEPVLPNISCHLGKTSCQDKKQILSRMEVR